jgi:response regulator of citrate/malate metabolism
MFMETKTANDGLSVLKAARSTEFTQVIVITAYGEPQLSETSMHLGAFDYLERNAPGLHFRAVLNRKMHLALDYNQAKLTLAEHQLS